MKRVEVGNCYWNNMVAVRINTPMTFNWQIAYTITPYTMKKGKRVEDVKIYRKDSILTHEEMLQRFLRGRDEVEIDK